MTTEEKLEQFHKICMEDAELQYRRQVSDHEKRLSGEFEAHEKERKQRQERLLASGKEKILREERRRFSAEQMKLRHTVSEQQSYYRDKLFSEVREKLSAFRKTAEYRKLVERQMERVREAAGEDACEIYLEEADGTLFSELPDEVKLCREALGGGTIGVIPAKHILIDQSFRTRLEEEEQAFCFTAEGYGEKKQEPGAAAGGRDESAGE